MAMSAEHRSKVCSPSPAMVTFSCKWKILEWEKNKRTNIIYKKLFPPPLKQGLWLFQNKIKTSSHRNTYFVPSSVVLEKIFDIGKKKPKNTFWRNFLKNKNKKKKIWTPPVDENRSKIKRIKQEKMIILLWKYLMWFDDVVGSPIFIAGNP